MDMPQRKDTLNNITMTSKEYMLNEIENILQNIDNKLITDVFLLLTFKSTLPTNVVVRKPLW